MLKLNIYFFNFWSLQKLCSFIQYGNLNINISNIKILNDLMMILKSKMFVVFIHPSIFILKYNLSILNGLSHALRSLRILMTGIPTLLCFLGSFVPLSPPYWI